MNITIAPRNPIKDFFHKITSKMEDCIFALSELKAQIIKSKWTAAEEQKILEQNRQQD